VTMLEQVETVRRLSNREKVLLYLQLHGSATNVKLVDIGGMRAMARVHELRDKFDITVTKEHGGLYRVTYRGERKPKQLSLV
jgi:hypothetical protein